MLFVCRKFEAEQKQPTLAPLPAFHFPTASTHFPFANSGVDFHFFGSFYIENRKGNLEKHYGLTFTCPVTRAVHLEICPNLYTDTFLIAFQQFTSRRCQPLMLYSDNEKTFIGGSEKHKKIVNKTQ